MQEIYKILQEELLKKLGSKEKVDELLQKLGEIVLMDVIADILEASDETTQTKLKVHLDQGEMGDFLQEAKNLGVDVEKYYTDSCRRALEDVFGKDTV